jgi:TPR repeat protein
MRRIFALCLLLAALPLAAEEAHHAARNLARSGALAEAAQEMRRLAMQGHGPAQLDLAVMLARGRGLPQDDAAASYWAERARFAAVPQAAELAALLWARLDDAARDRVILGLQDDLAAIAATGDHAALLALGVVASDQDDHTTAYVHFALAAAFGLPQAVDLRDAMLAHLPDDARGKAQEAAQTAFATHCAALPAEARIATCP